MAYTIHEKITKYNRQTSPENKRTRIVIHYVGEVSSAEANAKYFASAGCTVRKASCHYFVDSKSIWKSGYDNWIMWHCGAEAPYNKKIGGGKRFDDTNNLNAIGIEGCLASKNGKLYFTKGTVDRMRYLVMKLMKKYNIKADNVIRHFDVTGKECPSCYPYYDFSKKLLNKKTWKFFKRSITGWRVYKATDDISVYNHPGKSGRKKVGTVKKGHKVYAMKLNVTKKWIMLEPGKWVRKADCKLVSQAK